MKRLVTVTWSRSIEIDLPPDWDQKSWIQQEILDVAWNQTSKQDGEITGVDDCEEQKTIEIPIGRIFDRLGGQIEKVGLSPYALNEGASRSDKHPVPVPLALKLGIITENELDLF